MSQDLLSPKAIMRLSPIIPVIAIDDADHAIDLAHALIEGGINVLEITLRTPASLDAIKLIAKNIPQAVVGAGTVLNISNLERAIDAGAKFAISPGSTEKLLSHAMKINYPLLPGVATGSEIMSGLDLGYTNFKLFPAMSAGGINALKSFAGPFQQALFCPTGGINEHNFIEFLKLENVLCIGGSWIVPGAAIKAGDFNEITRLTASAMSLFKQSGLAK